MNRESLKNSGLLEQYILGLTSRKESLLVERALESTPGAREDFEALRQELDDYALSNGMSAPLEGGEVRSAADYEDLDHEMIQAMTQRNHSLVIWRYALMAACLVLLCVSGYLFRLSETNKSDVVTEKAHHAQDNNAHERALKHLEETAPDWSELRSIKSSSAHGTVILHYLDQHNLVFLDLSHARPLNDENAYFVFMGDFGPKADMIVPLGHQLNLHPVVLPEGVDELKVFKWDLNEATRQVDLQQDLVAALSLPSE
jgi:hypothetical protein